MNNAAIEQFIQSMKPESIGNFEKAPRGFKPDPLATAQIKQFLFAGVISLDDLIGSYQYQRREARSWHEEAETMLYESFQLEGEHQAFRKLAEKYDEAKRELEMIERNKRRLLAKHGGYIDLSKFRKNWTRKHGRLRSWVRAVEMSVRTDSDVYQLATLLDNTSRVKAKISRLTRQLRGLGKLSKEVGRETLLGLCDY